MYKTMVRLFPRVRRPLQGRFMSNAIEDASTSTRLTMLEHQGVKHSEKLAAISDQIAAMGQQMEKKFDKVDKKFDRFDERFDNFQMQMYIAVVGIVASTLGTAWVRSQQPAASSVQASSVQPVQPVQPASSVRPEPASVQPASVLVKQPS